MTQVYNPQWNRSMQVDTLLFKKMRSCNFMTQHTGGGCFAWGRAAEDDGYVWITDIDGISLGKWADRDEPTWICARYNADGDFICVDNCTLAQAIQLAGTLRQPAPGEGTSMDFNTYEEG